MKGPAKNPQAESISGEDVFAEITSLSKKMITDRLQRMIESAGNYHSWSLSDQDGARMIKLIKHKQRIICSSFSYQLNKHFTEFKSTNASSPREKDARDWQTIGLGTNGSAETDVLQEITTRYNDAFKEFDQTILKRLQACIKRPRANIYESPLQVKNQSRQQHHRCMHNAVNDGAGPGYLASDLFHRMFPIWFQQGGSSSAGELPVFTSNGGPSHELRATKRTEEI